MCLFKEFFMKRKMLALVGIVVLGLVFGLLLAGCDDKTDGNEIPAIYKDFYNYPTGMVDQNNGRLTVNNTVNGEILLFDGVVEGGKYLGLINSFGSVKLRLPEERFYSIVAVQKVNYEERKEKATQFSETAYYSNSQTFTISVSPSSTYGGGNWRFTNNTNYWVEVKNADLSQNYAVIQPNALLVTIPIVIGNNYPYIPVFRKEVKYDGKVIALVETAVRKQADTATTNANSPTFPSVFNNVDIPTGIRPAVYVRNASQRSVEVLYSNTPKTNGTPGGSFWIAGGQSAMITGFEAGDNTQNINFFALAWENNKWVPSTQALTMAADKVYEITIPNGADPSASDITVVEVDGSKYYGN
jgi:hypothetical protein